MTKSFESTIAQFLIRKRNLLALLSIILFLISAVGLTNLYFDSSYRAYFSEENPELVAFESMEKIYTKEDNVIIIIKSRKESIFHGETLRAIEELTKKTWSMPYSIRVDSITNFQLVSNAGETIEIKEAVENAMEFTSAELEILRARLLDQPELKNKILSSDGKTTGIIATVQIPLDNRTEATTEIAKWSKSLIKDFKKEHHALFTIALSGTVIMDYTFTEVGARDSTFLVPTSVALMFIILGILVRTFIGATPILVITIMSIISAMGAGGFFNYPLTSVTVTAPIIILTVAIANSVHVLSSFLDNYAVGKEQALQASLEQNLQPVFLASITTAIGFLTMNFSEVPPFNHLGNLVSIGVIFSLIFTFTVLPIALMRLPLNPSQKINFSDKLLNGTLFYSKKNRPKPYTTNPMVFYCANRNKFNEYSKERTK